MRPNLLKAKLLNDQMTVGPFVNMPSPHTVELMGWLGFDFVIIDCEHGISGFESTEHMIRAAELSGITPIVRIGLNLQQHIQRYIDAGAMGVLIPLVNSAADARAVVDAVKYPPLGRRGLAIGRAGGYGQLHTIGDYVEMANRETFIAVQIETQQAIQNADEIIATEGVDVVFLGPNDLSSAFGVHGQMRHPKVLETIEFLAGRIRAAGKQAGTIAADGEACAWWKERGINWLVCNTTWFLSAGARAYLDSVKGLRAAGA